MAELIRTFDPDGHFLADQDRVEFDDEIRAEFKKIGRITRRTEVVHVFRLTSDGLIYLQKRSKQKSGNAGLYDKTIGGHVMASEQPAGAVVRECAEELGFPVSIVKPSAFEAIVSSTDLSVVGIFRKIGCLKKFVSRRLLTGGEFIEQPLIAHVYLGYYDGAIRFIDGESSGVEVFSPEELANSLKEEPNKYTNDLRELHRRYCRKFVAAT